MKCFSIPALVLMLLSATSPAIASNAGSDSEVIQSTSRAFVPPASKTTLETLEPEQADPEKNDELAAVWPFGEKEATEIKAPTRKSSRKAFFLSLLLPGLGEYYVGSKRGIAFMGVEALAWWMYVHYTGKGNDIEDEFKSYANANWNYSTSSGYNYVGWLSYMMTSNGLSTSDLPLTYDELSANPAYMDSITQVMIQNHDGSGISHSLPSTKTQQYYEMIGKYPQFVYGWADIAEYNAALADTANPDYSVNIRNIESAMRDHYETLRDDSNSNLKMGQNGVNLMIVNRVLSAIDAARLAYHHNKGIESELSMVRVTLVQKQILDHRVPILMVTKKF